MVERVSWPSPIDYEIMMLFENYDVFENHDIIASTKIISVNTGYDCRYMSKRCRVLEDAGLPTKQEGGLYQLAEVGRSFLAGTGCTSLRPTRPSIPCWETKQRCVCWRSSLSTRRTSGMGFKKELLVQAADSMSVLSTVARVTCATDLADLTPEC